MLACADTGGGRSDSGAWSGSDLAPELKEWVDGKQRTDCVFYVPAGLLRIMDRDIECAGIPKKDADGRVVHVHALRHSFGTHLSASGVAPRTAQAAMRHSNISLTMNTYTDSKLLDVASAVESIDALRTVAPNVAPAIQLRLNNGHRPNSKFVT